jgi:hypothetical protein
VTFEVGTWVEVACLDGMVYRGVLQDFTDDYVIVNGCGFPLSMIDELRHG